jgi:ubiquinone/menaquinone biosynthesis C-methylase UbiE
VVFFDSKNKRLVFVEQSPDSSFWDKLWTTKNIKKAITTQKTDLVVLPSTKKYLKIGNKILEGGCGDGFFVYELEKYGFDCTGVDFATKTVTAINKHFPQLKVYQGDVRKLEFKTSSFDGYWSLGVIEHFYQGYTEILNEIKRVLKPDGYAFVTFPYLSPLRKWKGDLGLYPQFTQKQQLKDFYQFALNKDAVIKDFKKQGFKLIEQKPFDGFSGLRKEVGFLRFLTNPITKYSEKNILVMAVRFLISKLVEPFASHAILLVFQKKS